MITFVTGGGRSGKSDFAENVPTNTSISYMLLHLWHLTKRCNIELKFIKLKEMKTGIL